MGFENRNYVFAGAFVDELARAGLRHACVCPGSRSSPLTISMARHPMIRTWVHLDERSAAFFALGMARTLREPVAVVCTSGTAAANFFPAIVEAHYSRVPLLALTSDRPPELWEWGAPQTIDQRRMYGSHAKWSVDLSPPEVTADLLRYVRALASRVVATAGESPPGPVHVNIPFRDPLDPSLVPDDFPCALPETAQEAWKGRADTRPFAEVRSGLLTVPTATIEALAAELEAMSRGLIVCGPLDSPTFPSRVGQLATRLGYPVLADPLSQVRCGLHDRSLVVDSYDAFLRDPALVAELAPEVLLRFGAPPTSKPLNQYLESHRQARQIIIDGGGGWNDPIHAASEVIHSDEELLCLGLAQPLTGHSHTSNWAQRWLQIAARTREALQAQTEPLEELFEGKVFAELATLLPERTTLYVGNSMPVRDLDTFFPSLDRELRLLGNRGANGIDGVVSSALGASAVASRPLVAVLGDISFYHDMNGLLAAKRHGLKATVVVLNNNGGGIFSFLPQAGYPDVFEEYFGTPHGLDFRLAAEMYGVTYCRVGSWEELRAAVCGSLASPGTSIVEVPGDRARNVALHNRMWEATASATKAGERLGP